LLIGFVGVGKLGYERATGNPLPKGDGKEWVSIEGFINADDKNAVPVSKEEIIDLACYGIPILLGSILMVFGRLIASGGPRMSGSRSLFAFSSLFMLLSLVAIAASVLFANAFPKEARYGREALVFLLPLAEFWFVIALVACGLALKRPGTARRVGFLGFVFLLTALLTFGGVLHSELFKTFYMKELKPQIPAAEVRMVEQGGIAVGWLVIIFAYWLSVRSVRVGAREYMDTVAEKA
jgi:hypothetical protein